MACLIAVGVLDQESQAAGPVSFAVDYLYQIICLPLILHRVDDQHSPSQLGETAG